MEATVMVLQSAMVWLGMVARDGRDRLVAFGAAALPKVQEGQSMVEYAILAALIAVACIAGVTALGTGISGVFSRILGSISGIG